MSGCQVVVTFCALAQTRTPRASWSENRRASCARRCRRQRAFPQRMSPTHRPPGLVVDDRTCALARKSVPTTFSTGSRQAPARNIDARSHRVCSSALWTANRVVAAIVAATRRARFWTASADVLLAQRHSAWQALRPRDRFTVALPSSQSVIFSSARPCTSVSSRPSRRRCKPALPQVASGSRKGRGADNEPCQ